MGPSNYSWRVFWEDWDQMDRLIMYALDVVTLEMGFGWVSWTWNMKTWIRGLYNLGIMRIKSTLTD